MPGRSKIRAKPSKEGKTGRPPILTKELLSKIIDHVELLGMAESRAARAVGVSPAAVTTWKMRGRVAEKEWDLLTPKDKETERIYVSFMKALQDAEPKFEAANLLVIQDATRRDWRAALALIERRIPEHWGKHFKIVGDPDAAPIRTQTVPMSPAEIKARAERAVRALNAAKP